MFLFGKLRQVKSFLFRYRFIQLFLSIFLALSAFLFLANSPLPMASPLSVIITQPDGSAGDIVSEGVEFATQKFGDPWDYEQESDLLHWEFFASDPVVSNGVVDFITGSGNPRLDILYRGVQETQDIDHTGVVYPIDTTQYHWLSFRMNLAASGQARIWWFYDHTYTTIGMSGFVPVSSGWHTYVVDLASLPPQLHSWSNSPNMPIGFAIEPIVEQSNTHGQLDWVRLTKDNPAENTIEIAWENLTNPGASLEFYLDDDNSGFDGTLIHTEANAAASGRFNWGSDSGDSAFPTSFLPGDYYVYVKENGVDTAYSPGVLTIDDAPVLRFTAPGFLSGEDYATVEKGDPWDMSQATDAEVRGVDSYNFSNGILNGTNSGTDPQVEFNPYKVKPIDSQKYRYLTIRMLLDKPWTVEAIRAIWSTQKVGVGDTESILIYRGWHTYTLDLATAKTGHNPYPWQNYSEWKTFRVDPNSRISAPSLTFHIDHVYLTARDEANDVYTTTWVLDDDSPAAVTVSLYYDTDNQGFNGKGICQIASQSGRVAPDISPSIISPATVMTGTPNLTHTLFLPAVFKDYTPPLPDCHTSGSYYRWDTSQLTEGEYYLYAKVEDENNVTYWYSEAPLVVKH